MLLLELHAISLEVAAENVDETKEHVAGDDSKKSDFTGTVTLSIGALNYALKQLTSHFQAMNFFSNAADGISGAVALLLRLFDVLHPSPWEITEKKQQGTRSSSRLKRKRPADTNQIDDIPSASRLCALALSSKVP